MTRKNKFNIDNAVNLARIEEKISKRNAVLSVEKMPQKNFDEIVEKYLEMNVAHHFQEGNGRSMRLWLDHIFKTEIKKILANALTDKVNDREIFMKIIFLIAAKIFKQKFLLKTFQPTCNFTFGICRT